ncbi:hypothetical protein Drorol1_Dr00011812, partial [Drosera rotundifolia]
CVLSFPKTQNWFLKKNPKRLEPLCAFWRLSPSDEGSDEMAKLETKEAIRTILARTLPDKCTQNKPNFLSLRFLSSYRRSNRHGIGGAGWGGSVGVASSPNLSIWRRKKKLGKEGLIVAKELKRLQSNPQWLDGYIWGSVSRLLKSDLVAVLAEDGRKGRITHREQEKKNTYRIQPERSLSYPLGSVGTDSKETDILE